MTMLNLRLNKDAFAFAQEQINKGNYSITKAWEKEKPTSEQESAFLAYNSWHNYSLWFLAINCEESQGTKAYYEFPLGDFKKISHAALVAVKKRAEEYDHSELINAATTLMHHIEKQEK